MRATLALALAAAAATLPAGAEPYRIAVIPKGTTHEYWKSVDAGARKAQRELAADQFGVKAAARDKLRIRARFDEASGIKHGDEVGGGHRRCRMA